ncbi:hypothetical protein J6590_107904, partial [Homalodisca vitripennis]
WAAGAGGLLLVSNRLWEVAGAAGTAVWASGRHSEESPKWPLERPFGAPKLELTLEAAQASRRAASGPGRLVSPSGGAGALPSIFAIEFRSGRFFGVVESTSRRRMCFH